MRLIKFLVVVALMVGGLHLSAQQFSVEYTSELQTDYKDCNFINLLYLSGDIPLNDKLSFDVASISIAKTRQDRLLEDMQTFSNIEEENLPFALAILGFNLQIKDKHQLYLGIRNMNEDYFASPLTSFYTNSSCGVFPTISCNYDIANYPLASVGVHYMLTTEKLVFQSTIYNGTGYNHFSGRENVFRFCPKDDGLFVLSQLEFNYNDDRYFWGVCGHYGDETKLRSTVWTYTEQQITERFSLIASYSHAFGKSIDCKDFVGIGVKKDWKRCELGLFTDFVHFSDAEEFATELTFKFNITENIYFQPTNHFIIDIDKDHLFNTVGMIRLGIKY